MKRSVMDRKGMKKQAKRVLSCVLVMMLCLSLLCGCKYRITDQSVEDEVAMALAEAQAEWQKTAELEKQQAVDAALAEAANDEENEDEPEEIPEPDKTLMTDENLSDAIEIKVSEADEVGNTETAVEDTLQIVFMGDSIFDAVRDETGIAYQVGAGLGADVYNLAIGGTTAGLTASKSSNLDTWSEPSFLGVVYAMEGKVDRSIMQGYKAGTIIETLVPSKTDYFIIEYGTNDFLSYIPIGGDSGYHYRFASALEMGIRELQSNYPDAKIILCTPYYEQFWSADRTRFIGDVHTVNNGFGTLLDYISFAQGAAENLGAEALNMYDLLGIDTYSVDKMTEDGIHPSQECRAIYASILIDKINEMEAEAEAEAEAQTETEAESN